MIEGATDLVKGYVERTGGVAIGADQQSVKEEFIHLIHKLRSRYSLGYVSSNPSRDAKFRKIKLTLSPEAQRLAGDAGIITRKGYYARKPADSASKER